MSDTMEILALGIDFADDFTQLAYITDDMHAEPESFSVIKGEQKYLIPTVMYKSAADNRWYIGDDAVYRLHAARDEESGDFVLKNIPGLISGQNTTGCNGTDITADEVACVWFRLVLELLQCDISKIHNISVTIERPDKKLIDAIYRALAELGCDRKCIRVIDHAEAFIYYVINQKKDLWVNEVALFDFTEQHFIYRRLKTVKKVSPPLIRVEDTDFTDILNYDILSSDDGKTKADMQFLRIIKESFKKSVVSAVYLTGGGFYEKWAEESLNELCGRRRVFMGRNLFVKGSAFSALERYKGPDAREYFFDCFGRTKVNVGLLIVHEGREVLLSLSDAGTGWYEAGASVECIPDDIDQIRLVFTEPVSMTAKTVFIDITALPKRPNRMTRLKISLAYTDDVNCTVQIKDLGFGDFFRASEMVIKENIDIEKLF